MGGKGGVEMVDISQMKVGRPGNVIDVGLKG